MRAIMVMYDSLNRHMLEPYGCDWTITPNFCRLAQRAVQFENNYVGSMPCMPARRELHTGRYNFFHRGWGPLEPFDDSMPEILKNAGVYTHLVSDHQHYWEDGGATYHGRYSSWEISRGQEGDPWKADLHVGYSRQSVFRAKQKAGGSGASPRVIQDERNRRFMDTEEKTSQAVTFAAGLDFIRRNHDQDNWFLQIETFDPHEPFYTLPADKALYPHHFTGDADLEADWPPYAPVEEDAETVQHVRYNYAALVSKCDRYLGQVLDMMDQYDLWKDTLLIVNTDHGFLLGEHGWWGKSAMPVYEELAHIPLFIHDPRQPACDGQKRKAITQTIDLAPTLLEFFGVEIPEDMEGRPLTRVIAADEPIRNCAVFGYFGSQVNAADGRYLYMHSGERPEVAVYEYTLMPCHMRQIFSPEQLRNAQLAPPFRFTKGCPVLRVLAKKRRVDTTSFGSALYDLQGGSDTNVLEQHPEVVQAMKQEICAAMRRSDAPEEVFQRLGFVR